MGVRLILGAAFPTYLAGLLLGLFCGLAYCRNLEEEVNVNTRYTVESVEIRGEKESRLSSKLRKEIRSLVGGKFDPGVFEELTRKVREELNARSVTRHIAKGTNPEHIKVILEVVRKEIRLETVPSRFVWHSRQGWTGDLNLDFHGLRFGVVSDGEQLLERYAGFRAGYHGRIFTNRVRFGFDFESFHQQWHNATLQQLEERPDIPGIYRTRQNFQPTLSITLTESVTWTAGSSFQRLGMQYPTARTEGAHALTSTLRYRGAWGHAGDGRHSAEGSYKLRAAMRALESDFSYTRHEFRGTYSYQEGRESLLVDFLGGVAAGSLPLFERFLAGNAQTLRGCNKYDLSPVGGTRIAAGTAEYRHRLGRSLYAAAFLDSGAVWDQVNPPDAQHAAGIGIRWSKHGFYFYIGFPLHAGRADPLFMVGADF
jgi:hypothetical protein